MAKEIGFNFLELILKNLIFFFLFFAKLKPFLLAGKIYLLPFTFGY